MYERLHEPLLTRSAFLWRVARAVLGTFALIAACLAIGAGGYHVLEGLPWIDSFYAATMILTGMGPTCELKTSAGKVFVSLYALFGGLVFVTGGVLIFSPVMHRFLHRFHLDDES